jgi:DNA-binding NarL/FixJ family response regulator
MGTIKVALAEDNTLLREGISRIIDAVDDLELVGQASDLPELFALIEKESPDVVVTDIRMPPTGTDEGIRAASWLREHRPEVGVVVLSQYKARVCCLVSNSVDSVQMAMGVASQAEDSINLCLAQSTPSGVRYAP